MLRLKLAVLLAAAATLLPAAPRAEDWEGEYTDEWTDEWTDERPSDGPSEGYDVSVDDVGPNSSVTFDSFHSSLSPYGEWVSVGAYGRVWRPHVAADWRPYYYGRWEWTNEGWLWVSDEPFGWAAYHYGRWAYDGVYGWVWVPGYQWAPAWVHWRYSGDVVGWAPLSPGLSIYVSTYPYYESYWTFVPTARFVYSGSVYRYAYARSYTRHHYYRTAPAPARSAPRGGGVRSAAASAPAWGGPAPRAVEQRVGRAIRPARVVAASSPGASRARPGEVAVYRPEVRASRDRGADRGRPSSFAPAPRTRAGDDGRGAATAPRNRAGGDGRGAATAPRNRAGEDRREGTYAQPRTERREGEQRAAPPPRSEERRAPSYQTAPRSEPRGGGVRPSAPSSSGGARSAPSPGGGARSAPSPGGGARSAPSPGGGARSAPSGGGRGGSASGRGR